MRVAKGCCMRVAKVLNFGHGAASCQAPQPPPHRSSQPPGSNHPATHHCRKHLRLLVGCLLLSGCGRGMPLSCWGQADSSKVKGACPGGELLDPSKKGS